jgi:hypothetical protein
LFEKGHCQLPGTSPLFHLFLGTGGALSYLFLALAGARFWRLFP